jgi:hypothetical protein
VVLRVLLEPEQLIQALHVEHLSVERGRVVLGQHLAEHLGQLAHEQRVVEHVVDEAAPGPGRLEGGVGIRGIGGGHGASLAQLQAGHEGQGQGHGHAGSKGTSGALHHDCARMRPYWVQAAIVL